MAIIHMSYFSICLMRNVHLTAVLPYDKATLSDNQYTVKGPFPTLYMLHGVSGNDTSLLYGSLISRYAMENHIAVIMPEGDNRYYVNCEQTGERFGDAVGQELVNLTRDIFPLSRRREDTWIGGISMGGYGCMVNGLRFSETFGGIVSLGTGVRYKHLDDESLQKDARVLTDRPGFFEAIYNNNLDSVKDSEWNIEALARKKAEEKVAFPRIFMGAGSKDWRISEEKELAEYLEKLGAPVTFEEVEGGHDNQAWDQLMIKAFAWMKKRNE